MKTYTEEQVDKMLKALFIFSAANSGLQNIKGISYGDKITSIKDALSAETAHELAVKLR